MIVEEKEEFVKDDTLSKRYSLILHENVGYIVRLVTSNKTICKINETTAFPWLEEEIYSYGN